MLNVMDMVDVVDVLDVVDGKSIHDIHVLEVDKYTGHGSNEVADCKRDVPSSAWAERVEAGNDNN